MLGIFCWLISKIESALIDYNQSFEQSLFNNLTKDYNKAIRPTTVVSIKFQLDVKQLIALEEKIKFYQHWLIYPTLGLTQDWCGIQVNTMQ